MERRGAALKKRHETLREQRKQWAGLPSESVLLFVENEEHGSAAGGGGGGGGPFCSRCNFIHAALFHFPASWLVKKTQDVKTQRAKGGREKANKLQETFLFPRKHLKVTMGQEKDPKQEVTQS